MEPTSLFNLRLTNYSPYMAYTVVSTEKIDINYINNLTKRFNTKKYYNTRHYDLNGGDKHLLKTTSLADAQTLEYLGKNTRHVNIKVKKYYYSTWLLVKGKWLIYKLNIKCRWNDYINIIVNC